MAPAADADADADADALNGFLLPVSAWFRATFGAPTPPQRLGWPAIAAGRNALIVAPTGSGKTLAAFLAGLDHLWRHPRPTRGVRILYLSPLKALNHDVYRNLLVPLSGIQETAAGLGSPLESLGVAVRTGDTPQSDRQRMIRKPPDILITTPESLHLMLTSRARETLRSITHVIVDEIHALCPNKRGAFLALLLERLQAQNPAEFVRIGLSATQRPLEEVASYLGGLRKVAGRGGRSRSEPRPVTIVDGGRRKDLDLEVSLPAPDAPGASVWPAVERRLLTLIEDHRSTIVFANNRRVVERLTSHLNELAEADAPEGAEPRVVARSHHGSLSLEQRHETEDALKRGDLPAVVSTASLELGIDMGAVDLVCQVESPGGVARGLQRVGRAGHAVGASSRGRLIAKTPGDALEAAALAGAMLRGEVELLRVPRAPLDVLAQQVVACVAVDSWEAPALFAMVRGAYPYRDLPASVFEAVLEMVSGRFAAETTRDLRPRISWDRVHNTLHPLPGSSQLALSGGGTIPDTGQFPVYLGDGGPRLGELDEEFVFERRVGEAFILGTATWAITAIEPHRVLVAPAQGQPAVMPFWRGEAASRTAELGEAVGVLTREIAEHLADPNAADWLRERYKLDAQAARGLLSFVGRQVRAAGAAPDDRTVLVEASKDPAGETNLAVLTPFGGKLHLALKLALNARLRHRLGIEVSSLHADDGVLIRLPGSDEPPLDVFAGLTPELAESLIREELGESALFGLRFRQNASRALLMPRPDPGKRTPLWIQRLRAKDLLQVVRRVPDFPIVVETYRECLEDDLDLPRLRAFLTAIADGSIRVVSRRADIPSPFASSLVFRFTGAFLYEWDQPRGDSRRAPVPDGDLLDELLDPEIASRWIDPDAVGRVEARLRGVGHPPRTVDEMAEWLRRLGDLSDAEVAGPMLGFLKELETQGRCRRVDLGGVEKPERWIGIEEEGLYREAFAGVPPPHPYPGGEGVRKNRSARKPPKPPYPPGEGWDEGASAPAMAATPEPSPDAAVTTIVRRFLRTHALVGLDDLTARYPIDRLMAAEILERWAEEGGLARIDGEDGPRWADQRNLQDVQRLSIALRRRESVAVAPEVFADFVARRQHVHPETRLEGRAAVGVVLSQLQGYAASAESWGDEILPRRVRDASPAWLDDELASGGWTWRAEGKGDPRVALVPRDFAGGWPDREPEEGPPPEPDPSETRVLAALGGGGALFVDQIARSAGLEPSRVRSALSALARRGLATNDRLDPLRTGGDATSAALAAASTGQRGRPRLGSFRKPASARPEGRWSLTPTPEADPEASALAWASALLDRYGVLTRETAALDPWAPPWRDLAPWLARAELRGELRRGFFVEGLSGVQYATDESAADLARLASARPNEPKPALIATLDPANLYGSGAPLDVPLLEGGTARLSRAGANSLVLIAGRPVLIIEAHGRRLTGLASASEAELRAALALLPSLANPSRRVLKVETYNTAPALASPAAPWLADLGFVRDPPGMTFYLGW